MSADHDDAVDDISQRLVIDIAPAFVFASAQLPDAERGEFVRIFCAGLAGLLEHCVGHEASRAALSMAAALKPTAPTHPLQ